MSKKEYHWIDSVGTALKLGDWVAYLVPSQRLLSLGPIMRGTEKSVGILDISGKRQNNTWTVENVISRPFDIIVKIDKVMALNFIEKTATYNNSAFCAGAMLAKSEMYKIVAHDSTFLPDLLVSQLTDKMFPIASYYLYDWSCMTNQSSDYLDGIRQKQIDNVYAGFNWYVMSKMTVV